MAHLVRQSFSYHVDAAGKKVPAGTPGARKVSRQSRKWYGVGIPGQPPARRVPLAARKDVARRMLDDLVRQAERGVVGLPDRAEGRKPLAEHVEAFRAAVALGLANRGKKNTVPADKTVRTVAHRVAELLAGAGLAHPSDLNDAAPAKVAAYLRGRLGRPRTEGGMSHQTATFFLAAGRRFVWWLAKKKVPGVRADLLDEVPGFDPAGNRVHARRAVTRDELDRVLRAAKGSRRTRRGLTGPDRYHVYLVAFSTGLRSKELASLTPAHFDLGGDAPAVVLPGKATKNRKAARVPLSPAVAAELRAYLAGRPANAPVWPTSKGGWHHDAAKILRADLKAAGVPYVVDGPHGKEYADFHALRHTFVTFLAEAGANPKEMQELARHSTPMLTVGVYSHTRPERLAGLVAQLHSPGKDAGPFAHLTREQLELALAVSLGLNRLLIGMGYGKTGR